MFKSPIIRWLTYSFVALILIGKYSFSPDRTKEELSAKYITKASSFIEIDGVEVHYRDEGEGFPIVLIHGTGASLHTWDAWVNRLKNTHRVIRLDLPAYGLTGADPQQRYASSDYVTLIHNLLEELDVKEFYMGGNSLGGLVSWLYTTTYPKEVKKLFLLNASGFPFETTPAVIQLAKTPVLNVFLKYFTPQFFIEKNLKEVYFDDSKITAETIERYHDLTCYEGNRQAFIDRAKIEREDYTERLSLIEQPTLVLWGEEDAWIPVSDAAKFAEKIPHVEIIIMPKTGHVPMEERPMESLNHVLTFLED